MVKENEKSPMMSLPFVYLLYPNLKGAQIPNKFCILFSGGQYIIDIAQRSVYIWNLDCALTFQHPRLRASGS